MNIKSFAEVYIYSKDTEHQPCSWQTLLNDMWASLMLVTFLVPLPKVLQNFYLDQFASQLLYCSSTYRRMLGWWWWTDYDGAPRQPAGWRSLPPSWWFRLPPGQSRKLSHCWWPSTIQWWVLRPWGVGIVLSPWLIGCLDITAVFCIIMWLQCHINWYSSVYSRRCEGVWIRCIYRDGKVNLQNGTGRKRNWAACNKQFTDL